MTEEKQKSLIGYILLITVGFIWWGLFYLFGKLNVPMWIYKAALAFVCIYIPLMLLAITQMSKEKPEISKSKSHNTNVVTKVYGQ